MRARVRGLSPTGLPSAGLSALAPEPSLAGSSTDLCAPVSVSRAATRSTPNATLVPPVAYLRGLRRFSGDLEDASIARLAEWAPWSAAPDRLTVPLAAWDAPAADAPPSSSQATSRTLDPTAPAPPRSRSPANALTDVSMLTSVSSISRPPRDLIVGAPRRAPPSCARSSGGARDADQHSPASSL